MKLVKFEMYTAQAITPVDSVPPTEAQAVFVVQGSPEELCTLSLALVQQRVAMGGEVAAYPPPPIRIDMTMNTELAAERAALAAQVETAVVEAPSVRKKRTHKVEAPAPQTTAAAEPAPVVVAPEVPPERTHVLNTPLPEFGPSARLVTWLAGGRGFGQMVTDTGNGPLIEHAQQTMAGAEAVDAYRKSLPTPVPAAPVPVAAAAPTAVTPVVINSATPAPAPVVAPALAPIAAPAPAPAAAPAPVAAPAPTNGAGNWWSTAEGVSAEFLATLPHGMGTEGGAVAPVASLREVLLALKEAFPALTKTQARAWVEHRAAIDAATLASGGKATVPVLQRIAGLGERTQRAVGLLFASAPA